ncbi:metal ABC transporter ATP-binding protein [Defluviicoccus vanus]|uniref:ABC transporter ATP-binding protein n=1 Tax=Defluviicoccus vanus TaxID=111831 RepID=A0A7H1N0W8_9PROT|nr:ABC transporter ATP-binding protein [Defluviicoccus vanus]QNT69354.1 ABC transporter ATP-binding protein [Defluviicoccus vanus]
MSHIASVAAPILSFDNVTLGYDRHPAVHHLSGCVHRADLLAVVGPNGAGKSTLLKGIAGFLRPLGGSIRGKGLGRKHVAYLPQQAEIDRGFPLDVFDFVAMGLWQRIGALGGLGRSGRAQVSDALAAVGLSGFERRTIGTLSGGQMQRMLFARLLLQDAPLILLDEPFTAIDTRTVADLIALIERWHGERRTILCVLHDMDQVRAHFPHALLLARTPVAWGATDEVLTETNLTRARQLCEAWDETALVCAPATTRRQQPRKGAHPA